MVQATMLLVISILTANETGQLIKHAIGLLILTVMGGIALYFIIRRKGVLPISIILIHATLAISAIFTLLFGLPF